MGKVTGMRYDSVWDALEADAGRAENLKLRSSLMIAISREVARQGWTQAGAATRCALSQPRMNDLLRGRIDRFSLDALVNIATALGLKVRLDVRAA